MESTDYMTGKRRLEYYDTLRQMHSMLKDLMFADDELNDDDQNALQAVNSVLYLAEGVFATNKAAESDGEKFLRQSSNTVKSQAGRVASK